MTENKFPTGKRHVSFSEYRDWKECTHRHSLIQISKVLPPSSSYYLVYGTAAHAFCESWLKTRDREASLALAEASLEANWKDETVDITFNPVRHLQAKRLLKEVAREVPEWLDKTFPGWSLVSAEEPLYEELPGTGGYHFKGFVDAVIRSGDGTVWVLDWKTSTNGWNRAKREDGEVQMQLLLYRKFLVEKGVLGFAEPTRAGFVVINSSKDVGQKCDLVEVSLDQERVDRAVRAVTHMTKTIEKGIRLKNRDSCYFCPFKGTPHCT